MSTTYKFEGDFIDGQFVTSERQEGEFANVSPADLKEEVCRVEYSKEHVDRAVLAAKRSFRSWAKLDMTARIAHLNRLRKVFDEHQDQMAETISRETGKPLWEAKTEAKALGAKITVTLEHSINLIKSDRVTNALPNVDGVIRYKPRGVMAVIGPFNFPAHLANGHIVPALLAGNTVVFKPSDKTPMTGQLMAQLYQKAEFPAGVFNLVQGQAEIGKKLTVHEYVDGVLFTGSYEVGLKIKQDTLTHHHKILALEMGGKNTTVVWKDADLKKAVYESLIGSFLTTGQRCSCTSKIVLHKEIKDQFVEQFYESAKKISIGYWKDNPFMGPLISKSSVENYIRFQEIANREGSESLMRGKSLNLEKEGYYVTPSIHLVDRFNPESVYQNNEIFGPNVGIYTVDDFDEALAINNSSGFGLVMALFTKDQNLYEKALLDARVGLLNLNRTTNGASSKLPFGGMGKSGNDRPSGHFAINYCVVPVASLEDHTDLDESKLMPGIDFNFKH